jgi:prepilin-type N-terminal cleavage/methylation domain-containing protein/prepilin-type processing-associated H-X9-DG protein
MENPAGSINQSATGCRSAFTLLEMLVVVAIIGILAVLLVPTLKSVMEKSRTVKCLSNIRSLGQATLTFAADHDQSLPVFQLSHSIGGSLFWYEEIRPYMGAASTELSTAPNTLSNLPNFYCPSVDRKKGYPHTDYGANSYVFTSKWPLLPDAEDRTKLTRIPTPSKIALYSEITSGGTGQYPDSGWQVVVPQVTGNPEKCFPHRHGETVSMVFCDGHAESVPRKDVVADVKKYFGDHPFWK